MDTVITVFGSAQPSPGDEAYAEAEHLGSLLARAGFSVCNGGYGGTMEASAKGARAAGGTAIGITISALGISPNPWNSTVIPMPTLVERLQKLLELGEGFVVLRGGTGTLLELAITWEFLTKHLMRPKPVVCLGSFWTPLVEMMREQLRSEGRLQAAEAVSAAATAEECVTILWDRLG